MKRIFVSLLTALVVSACGEADADARTAADTLTRAQKDSIVSRMPIPGARGVRGAMKARDQANERTLTHDTLGRR